MEKLYDSLWNLKNTLSTPFYYTYQIYGKNVEFEYIDSSGNTKTNKIQEYNSMVPISVPTNKMSFKFELSHKLLIGLLVNNKNNL